MAHSESEIPMTFVDPLRRMRQKFPVRPAERSPAVAHRGMLAIGFGARKYIEMVKSLGRSFKWHNPDIPTAVVTDSNDPELFQVFDHRVPLVKDWGMSMHQKLHADYYTPFQETIYIDADCLVNRRVDDLFDVLGRGSGQPFGIGGLDFSEGNWYVDVAGLCRRLGVASIPKFNGGVFVFDRDGARSLFGAARYLIDAEEELPFAATHGGERSDELPISVAMVQHGWRASVGDYERAMWTTIDLGFAGVELDVLRGICKVRREGGVTNPATSHFLAYAYAGRLYRREVMKLRLRDRYGLPVWLLSGVVGPLFDVWDGTRVAAKQVVKRLINRI